MSSSTSKTPLVVSTGKRALQAFTDILSAHPPGGVTDVVNVRGVSRPAYNPKTSTGATSYNPKTSEIKPGNPVQVFAPRPGGALGFLLANPCASKGENPLRVAPQV